MLNCVHKRARHDDSFINTIFHVCCVEIFDGKKINYDFEQVSCEGRYECTSLYYFGKVMNLKESKTDFYLQKEVNPLKIQTH